MRENVAMISASIEVVRQIWRTTLRGGVESAVEFFSSVNFSHVVGKYIGRSWIKS